jgi:hypothetical protein
MTPEQMAGAEQPESEEQCICICKTAEGFEVGTHDDYMAESQGPEVPEGQEKGAMKTVASLNEALQLAAQMLQGDSGYDRQQQEQGFQQGAQGL